MEDRTDGHIEDGGDAPGTRHHYGSERAATDCKRVLRLPGFRSRKRGVPVRLVRYLAGSPSKLEDFPEELAVPENAGPSWEPRWPAGQSRPTEAAGCNSGDRTKSGEDWAWTREQPLLGRGPAEIEAELAARRLDKPNPASYAGLTVRNAGRSLAQGTGTSRWRSSKNLVVEFVRKETVKDRPLAPVGGGGNRVAESYLLVVSRQVR